MSKKKNANVKTLLQLFAVAVLFFSMLLTCGMYIDVKINGQTSSLPSVPEHEKQILLKTASSSQKTYIDDLIEPVFIGISGKENKICAAFDTEARTSLMNMAKNAVCELFSGEITRAEFENEEERENFVSDILCNKNFMLISFLEEIHSGLIVPCLSDGFAAANSDVFFGVKHIFLIENSDGEEAYYSGVALTRAGDVYLLNVDKDRAIVNFSLGEYDVRDGFSYFSFSDDKEVCPVMTSSFMTNKYRITTLPSRFGKEADSFWVKKLFEIFSLNDNFVKSYYSKNNAEISYVDGGSELTINDDGYVEYTAEDDGALLDTILGYSAGESGKFSFSDKILAIKNVINEIKFDNSKHCLSIVGLDYNEKKDKLSVYLKYFADGIVLSENRYDALFEITDNRFTFASFYALKCTVADEYSFCINQSCINTLFENDEETVLLDYYPVLEKETDGNSELYKVAWARSISR